MDIRSPRRINIRFPGLPLGLRGLVTALKAKLAELEIVCDAGFRKQTIILADQLDGKPLDDFEGPLMIVAADDLRHSRWIRQVKQVMLTRATAPPP